MRRSFGASADGCNPATVARFALMFSAHCQPKVDPH
jgi:hypothetical protein